MVSKARWFGHLRKLLPGVALGCALLLSCVPASFAGVYGNRHDERRQIEKLEEQVRQAEIAGDVPFLDRLLSDDFVGISMVGDVNTKAQQLQRMRTHAMVFTSIRLDDAKIKLLGQVAVVTSRARVEGTSDGQSISGTYRYTRVYLHGPAGAWKITNFEVTRIPN